MATTHSRPGLLVAVLAGMSFGASGAFIKPLLEGGWSPAAAVTLRALIGGIVLVPFALVALRGRWATLWQARTRVLMMGLVGVAGTQLVYFAAVQRLHVGTAILVEYLAPLLLVAWVWARTRTTPRGVVLIGSAVAVGGLVLVIGPGALGGIDALGLLFAVLAMVGCAAYYVIAGAPSEGLPPVALASSGLLLGGVVLGVAGLIGVVPFTTSTASVALFGNEVPWFVPLLVVGLIATAFAYVASIAATEMLGSRLASFFGLLEVVFATLYAWLLLGESLTLLQLGGGVLILGGIALVRSDRDPTEALSAPVPSVEPAGVPMPGEPEAVASTSE